MADRRTYRNRINRILADNTRGLFRDEYWQPVHASFRALESAGYEVNLTGANYDHDENGTPCRKVWTFEVAFGTSKPFYGIMTAAGAGTIEDPLSAYDVTAYVS